MKNNKKTLAQDAVKAAVATREAAQKEMRAALFLGVYADRRATAAFTAACEAEHAAYKTLRALSL